MYNKNFIKLNYHGPYEMGSWDFKDAKIGSHSVSFKDNEDYKKFLDFISNGISKFSNTSNLEKKKKEGGGLSLLDVGGYDGYFCNSISKKLKFSKVNLLEPRKKNIDKANFLKTFLSQKNNFNITHGVLDEVKDKYDVVTSFNVIHHLHEIDNFIKNLSNCTNDLVIVSTIVFKFKSNFINNIISFLFKKKIEQKDICYSKLKKKNLYSVYKYETNYYDGSTIDSLNLVCYPNPDYLEAIFLKYNLKIIEKKEITHKNSFRSFQSNLYILKKREINLLPDLNNLIYDAEIENYIYFVDEKILKIIKKLKINFLTNLIAFFSGKKKTIIRNLSYNYVDKINFEIAKNNLKSKNYYISFKILLNLVKKLNVDNRVFNRSIVLLIFLLKKKKKNPKAFLKFCHLSDKLLLKIISRLQVEYN
jgi:2-polyprenyl-3-methyl-5-hydroxy-6-metoxy-1,4-benzoquinol methylase